MQYVALLRGINVGGNSKVPMADLKQVFESLGYKQVTTYINSGNVLFESSASKSVIKKQLEDAISKKFGFDVPVFIVESNVIKTICSKVPKNWTNDTSQKTDVIFLSDDIDDSSILKKVVHKPELERVLYVPGALVWNIARENVTRGSVIKLIKNELYKKMTVRNINTVRKLSVLFDK